MNEIEMIEMNGISRERKTIIINEANRSRTDRYDRSVKTAIWNQFLRFTDTIVEKSVTFIRIFCAILWFLKIFYILYVIDDSLNSKFIRLISLGLFFFLQFVSMFSGSDGIFQYKDFFLLITMTYLSVIANLLDIIQGVSNDLMRNEICCYAILFIQCVATSINVGTLNYKKTEEKKYNLRRENGFCQYPNEMRFPRIRFINIDKTDISENKTFSHQFSNVFQNEENVAFSQQFPSILQNEENWAISQQFSSIFRNEENPLRVQSIFQDERRLTASSFPYAFQNNNVDSGRNDIQMTTFITTADVHAVEERSSTRIQEASNINISLEEEKCSQPSQNVKNRKPELSNPENISADIMEVTSTGDILPIVTVSRSTGGSLPIVTVSRSTGGSLPIVTVSRSTGGSLPIVTVSPSTGDSLPIVTFSSSTGDNLPMEAASSSIETIGESVTRKFSISKIPENDIPISDNRPITCTYNLKNLEKFKNRTFASTDESLSIKTKVCPNARAESKGITGKFSVNKVKNNIPISIKESNNNSQLECRTPTSLEDNNSQPSSSDTNQVTLEPLTENTNNSQLECRTPTSLEDNNSQPSLSDSNQATLEPLTEGTNNSQLEYRAPTSLEDNNLQPSSSDPNQATLEPLAEGTNNSQLEYRAPTSLEDNNSQPSSSDPNHATLEPLTDNTNNLSRPETETDAQPSTSLDSENDTQRQLTDSPLNQSQDSKISKKKITYRFPLEDHLPTVFDVDPNIPKNIFKNLLKTNPAEISSVKTIKILECSSGRKTEVFSSFETKEKWVYEL